MYRERVQSFDESGEQLSDEIVEAPRRRLAKEDERV